MWIRSSCSDRALAYEHEPIQKVTGAYGTLTLPFQADSRPLKQELEQLLLASLTRLAGGVLPQMPSPSAVVIERTRDAQHGDFASNVAMRLAKAARKNPRELAAAIVEALPESLRNSATAAALQDMIDLDLDAIAQVQPPRGYGRD